MKRIDRTLARATAALVVLVMTIQSGAQNSAGAFDDHQNMMDQLEVKALRRGPDPNNQSTFDEATANPFTNSMPDALTMKDDTKVTRPEQWPARRAEIAEDFECEVYGRIPANVPKVTWEVTATTNGVSGGVPIVTRTLEGHVDNSGYTNETVTIRASFTVPEKPTAPVPMMIEFGGGFPFGMRRGAVSWHQLAISNGWGYGSINPASIQPDNNKLRTGIIGLANKGQPRKPDDWGALRAWQWGVSRLIDYFENNPESKVDAKKVGIEGLSRYGKAAIVTEAFEPRIAVGLIGSSGEGGVKLHRHLYGEAVENLAGGEYYWMAGSFIKYGAFDPLKTAADLPVDSHELIAMCAPRPCFISCGMVEHGDAKWVDAHGSLMAGVLAGPVYRLLRKKDFGTARNYLTDPMPPVNQLIGGELAWRQHDGGHDVTPNWPTFFKMGFRVCDSVATNRRSERRQPCTGGKNSMRTFACKLAAGLAAAMMCGATAEGQSFVVTNYTFDTSASASTPAWGVWPNGAGSYISNGWNASDADNNPASGSMLITSTFTGANEQSVVWSGQSGDFNPPLTGAEITNFSCAIRFDPSSPTNATTDSFGSVAFYLNTLQHGAYPPTQIGGYYSIPASNTNWVFFSVPVSVGGSVYGITIQLETYGNALTGTSRMFVDDIQLTGGTNPPVYGTATVNWSDVHQRIDGFGASSAWNGNWTTNEADLLFSTNENISYQSNVYNGVGLSLLRNHIAYASTTSASDTPGTTETTIMQWAQERGARVWSTPWTPPAEFKSTHDIYDTNVATASGIDGGSYLGSGNNVTNQNYASQLANYVASMQKNYGVNIYAISVQNEPDANVTNYEACQWTAAQIHDFVTNLSPTLATKGVSSTKIIVPESQVWSGNTALYLPTLNDPKTAADVGIIANHDYVPNNNVGDQTAPAALAVFGKTLWETEVAILTGSDSSIANGVYYAQRIYAYLTQAQANAYHYWWLVALNTGDNEGLLDTSAGVTKRLFAFGQYSRFVRPNFYRIGATSATSTLVSAYKDSASTAFAIVVVNTNTATDVIETFNLTNFTAASVTPWVTSGALSLAPQSTVSVTNYSFTYRVPAMSIVTFAGQGNTPPVFEATPNQTANAGVTLLATNTATDTDLPAQTLTYSASSPLPLNAQINSATGVFMWRPLVSQANTTNTIQIQATDNGSPNLSATNSFVVVVNAITNPAISSVNVTQGQISMAVNGPFGPDYTLLTSTDLVNWQALLTSNSPATPFTFVATNGASQTKFYKVEIGP